MPCCGKGRVARTIQRKAQLAALIPNLSNPPHYTRNIRVIHALVLFQYTGLSGMTVLGPITGQRYRFTAPGAIVAVDPRDAPSIAGIPRLSRVPDYIGTNYHRIGFERQKLEA